MGGQDMKGRRLGRSQAPLQEATPWAAWLCGVSTGVGSAETRGVDPGSVAFLLREASRVSQNSLP